MLSRASLIRCASRGRFFSSQRALLQQEANNAHFVSQQVTDPSKGVQQPGAAGRIAAQNIEKSRERASALASLKGDIEIKPLPKIIDEGNQRYEKRFIRPTRKWSTNLKRQVPNFDENLSKGKKFFTILDENLPQAKRTINATDLFEPLDIGDAVDLSLSLNQSALAVIVEVPSSDDDPRYTIMNKLGELRYLERSAVKFRIPQLIPKEWLKDIIYKVQDSSSDYGSIKTTLDHYETYAVSPGARSYVTRPLVEVTNDAWAQIQRTSRKLEFIHRLIQTDGPREVSLFTLLKAIHYIEIEVTQKTFKDTDVDTAYETISRTLFEEVGDLKGTDGEIQLGKEYGKLSPLDYFEVSTFYSLVLALRKQSNLWSTSYSSRATLVPLSVTALPIHYANRVDNAVDLLKSEPLLRKAFHQYVESKDYTQSPPEDLEPIFFLLKEFAVGNLQDPKSVTLVSQLMKLNTDEDINRTVVYDFLSEIGYVNTHMTNPQHYTTALSIPNTGVSNKATIEQEFFEVNNVKTERTDDLAHARKDFKDLRVFCIDAETAHEIDDGVSIERLDGDNVKLHIHVADPASYMSKEAPLTKIAFERAFTTYQPEMISPMLPKSMSELAGLGIDGVETRALTFSIPFKMSTGAFDLEKADVQATILSKFPKYTYDDVDEVLAQIRDGKSNLENPEHRDLQDLFEVSKKLRDNRVQSGAVIFGESLSAQVHVTEITNPSSELDDNVEVNISKQKATDSVLLVSELMILGNRIAANVLSRNAIGGIFKGMTKLNLTGTAAEVVPKLNEYTKSSSRLPSLSEIVKSFKFIVPAFYSHQPREHLMLGVDKYAPSTSPLRRFGDLVNHFQFHQLMNGEEPLFSEEEILSMTLHIEARNDILRKASRGALAYYSIKQLEASFKAGETALGDFMVTSRALDGVVFGQLIDHGIMTKMKVSVSKKPPAIGDVVKNFDILGFDSVGGMLSLKEVDE